MSDWQPITNAPDDGVVVETRIGEGPSRLLVLHRTQWWTPDMRIMAYEAPTHWRDCEPLPEFLGAFRPLSHFLSVPDGGLIVVAGAYEGRYLEYLADKFPNARLVGYEPQRGPFETARERLKDKHNVTVWNLGLSTGGPQCFQMHGTGTDGASLLRTDGDYENITTINALEALPSPVNLLVLNMEGYEWALLPYLLNEMMHHHIRTLAVQFHPEYVSPQHAQRVLAQLREYYEPIYFDYPAWCYFVRTI